MNRMGRETDENQEYKASKRSKRARLWLWLLRFVLALLLTYCTLYLILDRSTSAMFKGKAETQRKLAESVIEMQMNVDTGSEYFDLEWMYGSEQMKALGLLSMMKEHPEFREQYRLYVEKSIDYLLGDMGRGFDIDMYRYDILDSLSSPTGHIAYLGYTNLVLSAYRYLYPDNRYNEWNDRFSEAIAKRFREAPSGCAFTLGCARIMKDESTYRSIMRSLNLVGVPDYRDGQLSYGIGGSLGNNLLFAMLTAQPDWRKAQ